MRGNRYTPLHLGAGRRAAVWWAAGWGARLVGSRWMGGPLGGGGTGRRTARVAGSGGLRGLLRVVGEGARAPRDQGLRGPRGFGGAPRYLGLHVCRAFFGCWGSSKRIECWEIEEEGGRAEGGRRPGRITQRRSISSQSTGRFSPCFFVNSSAFLKNFLRSFEYSSARSARSGCSGWGSFTRAISD